MTFPHPDSLYSLLMSIENMKSDDGRHFRSTMSALTQEKGLPLERYEKLMTRSYAHLTHDTVTDLLFSEANKALRERCIGQIGKDEFDDRFANGLGVYGENGIRLGMVFTFTSFPETYFHPQIADVLHGSGKLRNKTSAATRVSDTANIMLQAVSGSPLATIALVASSHQLRQLVGNANYNENTVEFTLLTFSYFGAKRSGVRDADWFFYWKIFGSLMGLGPENLHENYDEAGRRMKALHRACTFPVSKNSSDLLDVFLDAYDLREPRTVRELNGYGLVSKRLWQYMQTKGVWPADLVRSSDIPTD